LASGDPFMIIQEAGVDNNFNYTTAAGVYLAITTTGTLNVDINIQSYVASTSGVKEALSDQGKTFGGNFIVGNGEIIGKDLNSGIDINGIYLAGIEI